MIEGILRENIYWCYGILIRKCYYIEEEKLLTENILVNKNKSVN